MPDDSSGIYSVPAGTIVSTGDTILPSQHNPWANDSASAISARFSKDGRAPATGNWNLNNFRITGLGAPVAGGDAVNKTYADALATGKLDILQPSVDVASAATTDIGAATSQNVQITGSVTITSFGTAAAGTFRRLRFAGALTLTHNGTSLILPGAANITTAPGDIFEFISEGSGNWRCVGTQLASGKTVFSYPFTAFYESSEQTIVAGEQRTLAHGFGVPPKLIAPVLICKTAEFGYSVGDIVPANPQVSSSVLDSYGASFEFSGSTNILVRYGNVANPTFLGTNKTTGGAVNLTNANWRLIMRAWA